MASNSKKNGLKKAQMFGVFKVGKINKILSFLLQSFNNQAL